jgi:hypothetical protein
MRCEDCKLITRPDIAAAMKEDYCRCDPEMNEIFDFMKKMSKDNDKLIKKLANKLNKDK